MSNFIRVDDDASIFSYGHPYDTKQPTMDKNCIIFGCISPRHCLCSDILASLCIADGNIQVHNQEMVVLYSSI